MNAVTAAKRSISFDPDVLAAAEQLAAAENGGNLSALVNDAVSQAVARSEKLRGLGAFLDELDRKFGPVPDDITAEVDAEWEEWESRSTAER